MPIIRTTLANSYVGYTYCMKTLHFSPAFVAFNITTDGLRMVEFDYYYSIDVSPCNIASWISRWNIRKSAATQVTGLRSCYARKHRTFGLKYILSVPIHRYIKSKDFRSLLYQDTSMTFIGQIYFCSIFLCVYETKDKKNLCKYLCDFFVS